MTDKSELEYLAEELEKNEGALYVSVIRRAIDLRKQDQAHPVDNTPKGGGDDLSKRLRNWMTTPFGIHGTAELCDEAASALDALLAERDAARAELREAEKVAELSSRIDVVWGNDDDEANDDIEFIELMTELRKVLRPWRVKRLGNEQLAQHEADLDRVGKQP